LLNLRSIKYKIEMEFIWRGAFFDLPNLCYEKLVLVSLSVNSFLSFFLGYYHKRNGINCLRNAGVIQLSTPIELSGRVMGIYLLNKGITS